MPAPTDQDHVGQPRHTSRPTWRRALSLGGGVVLTPLGLLWVLQGADAVRIEPVLCAGECEPITGGSPTWLAIGGAALLCGLWLLLRGLRRR